MSVVVVVADIHRTAIRCRQYRRTGGVAAPAMKGGRDGDIKIAKSPVWA